MPKSKPPRTRRSKPRRLCSLRKAMVEAIEPALALNAAIIQSIDDFARRAPSGPTARKLAVMRAQMEHHRRELLASRADALGPS